MSQFIIITKEKLDNDIINLVIIPDHNGSEYILNCKCELVSSNIHFQYICHIEIPYINFNRCWFRCENESRENIISIYSQSITVLRIIDGMAGTACG